jgi:L-lactate dehydrogenase complex protein LldG
MQDSSPREKILKKIRNGLIQTTLNPYPDVDLERSVYKVSKEPLVIEFVQEFRAVGGQFVFCESELDFVENLVLLAQQKKWNNFFCWEPTLQQHLSTCDFPFESSDMNFKDSYVGITGCEALIARTGSILVSSKQQAGRRLFIYPHIHVVLAYSSQLLPDTRDGLNFMQGKYPDRLPSLISNISGPSKTNDIENISVTGAHGPKEIYLFLIDDID